MVAVWLSLISLFAPASGGPRFHFAIIGDRTGRAVPGVYEQAWREAARSRPDFVITVGDAIEGMNDGTATDEWRLVKPNWNVGIPVYHTPGNHDIWNLSSERLYTAETGGKPFYSFDFRQAHFVVLDNSRTDDLSAEQMKFLRADLENTKGRAPVFVVFHRPFWLIPLMLRTNGFVFDNLVHQYGVCCVISGHGHQFKTIEHNGIEYLEVGSSGASLAATGPGGPAYDDGWFYQYVYATVSGNSVDFEIRELGPPNGRGRVQTIHAGAARGAGAGQH